MGLDGLSMVVPVPDTLHCSVCRRVFVDPVFGGCKHTFCRSCIEPALHRSASCPECRKHLQPVQLQPNTLMQHFLDGIVVNCEGNCGWTGPNVLRDSHHKDCLKAQLHIAMTKNAALEKDASKRNKIIEHLRKQLFEMKEERDALRKLLARVGEEVPQQLYKEAPVVPVAETELPQQEQDQQQQQQQQQQAQTEPEQLQPRPSRQRGPNAWTYRAETLMKIRSAAPWGPIEKDLDDCICIGDIVHIVKERICNSVSVYGRLEGPEEDWVHLRVLGKRATVFCALVEGEPLPSLPWSDADYVGDFTPQSSTQRPQSPAALLRGATKKIALATHRTKATVAETSPCVQEPVTQTAWHAQEKVAPTSPRVHETVAPTSAHVQANVAEKAVHAQESHSKRPK